MEERIRYAPLRDKITDPAAAAFEEVDHFVDQDVFEASGRFFGQRQVDPDAADPGVAGAPAGLHFFDAPVGDGFADFGSPLGDEIRDLFPEPVPMPAVHLMSFRTISTVWRRDLELSTFFNAPHR